MPIIIDSPNPISKFGLNILTDNPETSADFTKASDQKGIIDMTNIEIGINTVNILSLMFFVFKNKNGTKSNG